jgi:hypothetical protein
MLHSSILQILFTADPFVRSLSSAQGPLARAVVETSVQLSNNLLETACKPRLNQGCSCRKNGQVCWVWTTRRTRILEGFGRWLAWRIRTEAESSMHNLPTEDLRFSVQVCLECTSCGYTRHKEEIYRHLSLDIAMKPRASKASRHLSTARANTH